MKQIQTRATSRRTAIADEIVLRQTDRVRLIFLPTLVSNQRDPLACVRGEFVYQKKLAKEEWISLASHSLGSLKAGEHYKLELKSEELLTLMRTLGPLYRLVRREGVPRGRARFTLVESGLAAFFELGETDLNELFELHKDRATATLLNLVKWLTRSSRRQDAIERFASADIEQLPDLNVIAGLAALKGAISYWEQHRNNANEEFWQEAISDRSFVLSQLFSYPVIVIRQKAYVGGKRITNTGGNIVDFLSKVETTDSTVLIEIKTPQTKLLTTEYRAGAYPLSRELTGAITQILRYRQSLLNEFHSLTAGQPKPLVMGEPKCLVIAGDTSELDHPDKRESFELMRERLQGVTVVTYDEMFRKLKALMAVLQAA